MCSVLSECRPLSRSARGTPVIELRSRSMLEISCQMPGSRVLPAGTLYISCQPCRSKNQAAEHGTLLFASIQFYTDTERGTLKFHVTSRSAILQYIRSIVAIVMTNLSPH